MHVQMKGVYKTQKLPHLEGPALITYAYAPGVEGGLVYGTFEQGGPQGAKIEIKPGLFVAKGMHLKLERDAIITWIETREDDW